MLVTMPTGEPWAVPHRQGHTDVGYDNVQAGVKVWALLGDLERGGGGTPQVAVSHRMIARYLEGTQEREFHGDSRSGAGVVRVVSAFDQ
ncbi:hypothetical protein E1263_25340 [Kribbella antibiotica]|uniref:Uncharacterized protein n=1 Tax=Kribbella antibiotica TaxID=190195 RepID=A0A4R4ZE92_9ACTN|nr:hypothetical protein [Kribbella antibiotica]TDD56366.1 hypothetical protein E1263_25340 [Kribbella antibiotica]